MSSAKAALESDTRVSFLFFSTQIFSCAFFLRSSFNCVWYDCCVPIALPRCSLLKQEGNTKSESIRYLLVHCSFFFFCCFAHYFFKTMQGVLLMAPYILQLQDVIPMLCDGHWDTWFHQKGEPHPKDVIISYIRLLARGSWFYWFFWDLL